MPGSGLLIGLCCRLLVECLMVRRQAGGSGWHKTYFTTLSHPLFLQLILCRLLMSLLVYPWTVWGEVGTAGGPAVCGEVGTAGGPAGLALDGSCFDWPTWEHACCGAAGIQPRSGACALVHAAGLLGIYWLRDHVCAVGICTTGPF